MGGEGHMYNAHEAINAHFLYFEGSSLRTKSLPDSLIDHYKTVSSRREEDGDATTRLAWADEDENI